MEEYEKEIETLLDRNHELQGELQEKEREFLKLKNDQSSHH